MRSRRLFALALASLLSACQPAPLQDAGRPLQSVLVLSPPGVRVVEQALEAIARRNQRAPAGEAPLGVDVRPVGSGAEATAVVRSLLPQIERYQVIFTPSQTFARAAQLLVPDRPIVFDGIDNPVKNCLVDSLRRPGRNATGYMHLLPDTELKMLELLHDGFRSVREVVVLVSGEDVPPVNCDASDPVWQGGLPVCKPGLRAADASVRRVIDADQIEAFGQTLGLSVRFLVMCEPRDFELLRSAAAERAALGFLVPWHSLFDDNVQPLVDAIAATRRPVVYPNDRFTKNGGVLSLEPILNRGPDRATVLTLMQVIGGRSPADLPVQGPRGFEIVVNAKAAAQQGLRPSDMLLRRADRVLP